MENVVEGLKLVRDKIIAASAKRDPVCRHFVVKQIKGEKV